MIRTEKKPKGNVVRDIDFMSARKPGRPAGDREKVTLQLTSSAVAYLKSKHGEGWRNAVDAVLVNHINAVKANEARHGQADIKGA